MSPYESRVRRIVGGYDRLHEAAVGFARTGERWLSVGCGTGEELARWRERGVVGVGTDPDPERVAVARARGLDARPETDETGFDGATLLLVRHFLPTPEARAAILAETVRRVRPGGIVLVAELVAPLDWPAWRAGMIARGADPARLTVPFPDVHPVGADERPPDAREFWREPPFAAWATRGPVPSVEEPC